MKALRYVILLLSVQSIYRIVQSVKFQGAQTQSILSDDLIMAFYMGFRYDLVLACYLGAAFYLLEIARHFVSPSQLKSARFLKSLSKGYFVITLVLVTIALTADLYFYSFFQDHLNVMVFAFFEDDTKALLKTFVKNYPVFWVIFAWILLGFFLLKVLWPWVERPQKFNARWIPLVLVLLVLGGRGSLGLFPLSIADATISKNPLANYIAYNGVHSLYRACKLKLQERSVWNQNALYYDYANAQLAAHDYFQKDVSPDQVFQMLQRKTSPNPGAKPHVVLIVMESFGSDLLRFQSPSFDLLGKLAPHLASDLHFSHFLPGQSSTIGSLSSLLVQAPHRPEGAFLTEGRYRNIPFETSPAWAFKKNGYQTRFIYGGAVGWRDIDKYARLQGFDSVEGDFEVEKKLGRSLQTHSWGIYDHDVYEYLEKTLSEAKTPELVVVMTTSNHPPFEIPDGYQLSYLNLPQALSHQLIIDQELAEKRLKAFRYANDSVGQFISQVKSSPLADRMVLGVTGDHSFLIVNYDDEHVFSKWKVPFYVYAKNPRLAHIKKKLVTEKIGSHIDVFPTLMDLSLDSQEYLSFGESLLSDKHPSKAFFAFRMAFSDEGASLVFSKDHSQYLKWKVKGESLERLEKPTVALETLSQQYRGLMAYLDFFFEHQRKNYLSKEMSP